jgi:hypothetical protein
MFRLLAKGLRSQRLGNLRLLVERKKIRQLRDLLTSWSISPLEILAKDAYELRRFGKPPTQEEIPSEDLTLADKTNTISDMTQQSSSADRLYGFYDANKMPTDPEVLEDYGIKPLRIP